MDYFLGIIEQSGGLEPAGEMSEGYQEPSNVTMGHRIVHVVEDEAMLKQ
jgi:hypothetical protein